MPRQGRRRWSEDATRRAVRRACVVLLHQRRVRLRPRRRRRLLLFSIRLVHRPSPSLSLQGVRPTQHTHCMSASALIRSLPLFVLKAFSACSRQRGNRSCIHQRRTSRASPPPFFKEGGGGLEAAGRATDPGAGAVAQMARSSCGTPPTMVTKRAS